MRWVVVVLVAALAGCGGGDDGEPSRERSVPARTPGEYPVAYAVARSELAVLAEWLFEQRIDLDRPRVPEAGRMLEAWDVPVIVITADHARRYGRRLERLRPSEAKLRSYYEAFSEVSLGTAGEGMKEYLDAVRAAMRAIASRSLMPGQPNVSVSDKTPAAGRASMAP